MQVIASLEHCSLFNSTRIISITLLLSAQSQITLFVTASAPEMKFCNKLFLSVA